MHPKQLVNAVNLNRTRDVNRVNHSGWVFAAGRLAAKSLNRLEALDARAFTAFFTAIEREESDRALPVVALGYIDRLCTDRFLEHLNPNVADGVRSLAQQSGPLSSLSNRIAMMHALRWISDDTAADLHTLRRIRNEFAHDPFTSFSEDRVASLIDNPRLVRSVLSAVLGRADNLDSIWLHSSEGKILRAPAFDSRLRFLIAAFVTGHVALEQLSTVPASCLLGSSAEELLAERSDLPVWLVEWKDGFGGMLGQVIEASGDRLKDVDAGWAE